MSTQDQSVQQIINMFEQIGAALATVKGNVKITIKELEFSIEPVTEDMQEQEPTPEQTRYTFTSVRHYTSGSGNPTWQCKNDSGDVMYIRQSNKALFLEHSMALETMMLGDTWDCEIVVRCVPDGDFIKPVRVERVKLVVPEPEFSSHSLAGYDGEQRTAIKSAQKYFLGEYRVYVDTETNDWAKNGGVPIEIAVVDANGNVLFDQRIALPDGNTISTGAQSVHGISEDDLLNCPTWLEVQGQFEAAIKGKKVVIFNKGFDCEAFKNLYDAYEGLPFPGELEQHNVLCAQDLMTAFLQIPNPYGYDDWKWASLAEAAARFEIDNPNPHSALGDALTTRLTVQALGGIAGDISL